MVMFFNLLCAWMLDHSWLQHEDEASWINRFVRWSFYPEHFVHLHRHLESTSTQDAFFTQTNKRKKDEILQDDKWTYEVLLTGGGEHFYMFICRGRVSLKLAWKLSYCLSPLLLRSIFFILQTMSQITHTLTPVCFIFWCVKLKEFRPARRTTFSLWLIWSSSEKKGEVSSVVENMLLLLC